MPFPTIQQFFGTNATLNGTTLTINLNDFTGVGLTPATAQPGDIFASMLLRIISVTPVDAATTDKQWPVTVGTPFISVVRDNEQLERSFPVSFYTPFTAATFDPDSVIG